MTVMKPYFIFANCVLLVCAAYLGVKNTYDLATARLDTLPARTVMAQPAQTPALATRRPLAHYHSISLRNLFDVKSTATKTAELVDIEALAQTELKLKLWGTVLGSYAENSYAVIEDLKSRSQNLYKNGDAIQNAEVKMILREKVILRVNDKDEILEMEKVQETTQGARPSLAQRTGPPAITSAPMPGGMAAPPTQEVAIDRSEIEAAMANVNELMQQVRIMPHFENGQSDGFRLSGIAPHSLMRKMGLRNGDVITGVNGQPIQTMEDAMGFYQQLSDASAVSIQMKRRGRDRTIEYKIK